MAGLSPMGGAPQLGTENVGGLVAPFKGNPLVELITALGQFPEMQRKAQEERLQLQQQEIQNKYLPQQIEAQTKEQQAYANQVQLQSQNAQRMQAQQSWNQLGQMVTANPAWAKSPTVIQNATQLAQQLGVPPPINADGSLNTDVFKTPWGQAILKDKTLIQQAMAIPPGPQRDAFLNSFSGVPESLRTAQQTLTPKDQAEIIRAHAYMAQAGSMGRYRDAMTSAVNKRLAIQKELAQSHTAVDQAHIVQLLSSAHKADVDADTEIAKTNIAAQNAAMRGQELDLRLREFDQRANMDSQRLLQNAAKATIGEVGGLDRAIDATNQQIISATANNASDATLKKLNDRLYDLTQRKDKLLNSVHNANAVLKVNVGGGGPAVANTVKSQSHAQRVTATPIKSGPSKVVRTGSSNGRKVYQLSDGSIHYDSPTGPVYKP